MNKVTYRVTLDLKRPGVQHTIYAKRDDAHSREVVFTLRVGSKAYSIDDNTSAYLYALADGAEIFADCVISGSMITAELTTNILNAKNTVLELRLTDGTGAVLTTPQVKLISEEAIYSEDAITATNDYSALLNAITKAENSRIVNITAEGNVLTITYADGQTVAVELNITVEEGGGGVDFTPGHALELTEDDVLNVKTTDEVSKTNALPLTSKGAAALEEAIRKDFPDMPNVPVQSVNGKTGAVNLSAEDVGARPSTWTPSYSDVGADKSGTAASAVSSHNTNASSHNDIRLLLEGLTTRLNALANSDDTTLDQMAEVVAYIKDNRELLEQVTTGKVSVSDIVNNLTTNTASKPLSAAQGVALKALIDAIPAWAKQANKPTYKASEVGAVSQTELEGAVNTALAEAKASGEFDGADGENGFSPEILVAEISNGYRLKITDKYGTNEYDILHGTNGKNGTSVTITDTIQSDEDGGINTVVFSDGTTLDVQNGSRGGKGEDGTSVTVTNVTTSSADGGSNVVTFSDGKTLIVLNGSKGSKGDKGDKGYTPVKGTDYFTPADINEIVNSVYAKVADGNGVAY